MNTRKMFKDQAAFDKALSILTNCDDTKSYVKNIKDSIKNVRNELDNIEKELDIIQDLNK